MLKVTARPAIYKQFRYASGKYPVKILLIFKGKSTYLVTNIILSPEQLTSSLKIKDPYAQQAVNNLDLDIRRRLNALSQSELAGMDIYDIARFLSSSEKEKEEEFRLEFFAYGRSFAASKIKTAGLNYLSALKALSTYTGKTEIDISEINSSFLYGFEAWLKRKYGDKARAVSLYLGHIRTIHYRAQKEFNIPEEGKYLVRNPFAVFKVPAPPRTKHRDLDREVIQEMINDRNHLTGARQVAVDAFLLSFCLCGMNMADMYECAAPSDGVITYFRHKTTNSRQDKAESSIQIPKVVLPLYNKYIGQDGRHAFTYYSRYSTPTGATTCIDRGLRLYASDAFPGMKLSTYNARHSWATMFNKHSHDRTLLNDGLVHVNTGDWVTDIYVRKDFEALWKANERFLEETFDWSAISSLR